MSKPTLLEALQTLDTWLGAENNVHRRILHSYPYKAVRAAVAREEAKPADVDERPLLRGDVMTDSSDLSPLEDLRGFVCQRSSRSGMLSESLLLGKIDELLALEVDARQAVRDLHERICERAESIASQAGEDEPAVGELALVASWVKKLLAILSDPTELPGRP